MEMDKKGEPLQFEPPSSSLDAPTLELEDDLPPAAAPTLSQQPSLISSGLQELLGSPVGRRFLLAYAYANFQEELVLSWQLLQTLPDPPQVDQFSTFVTNFVSISSPLHVKMPDQLRDRFLQTQARFEPSQASSCISSIRYLLLERLRLIYVPFKSTVLAVVR